MVLSKKNNEVKKCKRTCAELAYSATSVCPKLHNHVDTWYILLTVVQKEQGIWINEMQTSRSIYLGCRLKKHKTVCLLLTCRFGAYCLGQAFEGKTSTIENGRCENQGAKSIQKLSTIRMLWALQSIPVHASILMQLDGIMLWVKTVSVSELHFVWNLLLPKNPIFHKGHKGNISCSAVSYNILSSYQIQLNPSYKDDEGLQLSTRSPSSETVFKIIVLLFYAFSRLT